jgi:hypothetical protein
MAGVLLISNSSQPPRFLTPVKTRKLGMETELDGLALALDSAAKNCITHRPANCKQLQKGRHAVQWQQRYNCKMRPFQTQLPSDV